MPPPTQDSIRVPKVLQLSTVHFWLMIAGGVIAFIVNCSFMYFRTNQDHEDIGAFKKSIPAIKATLYRMADKMGVEPVKDGEF